MEQWMTSSLHLGYLLEEKIHVEPIIPTLRVSDHTWPQLLKVQAWGTSEAHAEEQSSED